MQRSNRPLAAFASLSLLLGAIWSMATTASAQSAGRIPARLAGDWQAPEIEDLAVFARGAMGLGGKDKDFGDPKKRKETLATMRELIDGGKVDATTRVNFLSKYNELFARQVDELHQQELSDYAEAYTAFAENDAPAGAMAAGPKPKHDESLATMQRAIDAHRSLIETYPQFRKKPDFMLRLAMLLGRAGSPNALPTFEQVAQAWAGKRHGQLAAIGAADMMLKAGKPDEAKAFLKKAIKGKDGPSKRYARYRMSWVGLTAQAAATDKGTKSTQVMRGLFERSCLGPVKDMGKTLCADLRSDLVFLWSESGKEAEAKGFFKKVGDQEGYLLVLERSGGRLARAGQFADAAERFAGILKDAPARADSPRVHAKLVGVWAKADRSVDVCTAITGMKKSIMDVGAWRKANDESAARLRDAEELVQNTLLGQARLFADKFKATKGQAALATSNCAYALYVDAFPKAPGIQTVRFAYAEGLAVAGKPQDAARQYLMVAEAGKFEDKLALSAAEKMLPLQEQVVLTARAAAPDPELGKAKDDTPLSETESLWVRIVDQYAKMFPAATRLPALRLDVARVFLSRGHYKTAVGRLDALAKSAPKSKEALVGAKLVLALFDVQRNYLEVVRWAKDFHGRTELSAESTAKAFFREAWRLGMWNVAEALVAETKVEKASKAYVAYQEEFPQAADADQALGKASGLYLSIGKGKEGIRACETLISGYAKSSLRAGCRLTASDVYTQLLDYESAAISQAAFAKEYPQDPRAMQAYLRAADLFVSAQNTDMAVQVLSQVVKLYSSDKAAGPAQLRLAEVRDGVGEIGEALDAYQRFATTFGAAMPEERLYAEARAAALLREHRDSSVGLARLTAVEKGLQGMPKDRALKARSVAAKERLEVARAMTPDARDWFVSYSDAESFKRTLASLSKKLRALTVEYERVVAIQDPEQAVAAHYLLGNAYEDAMQGFKAPTDEAELTPQALQDATKQREAFLHEAQKSMLQSWEAGYALAKAKDRHEAWRRLTLAKLSRLLPGKYKESPEQVLNPLFTSHRLHDGTESKQAGESH